MLPEPVAVVLLVIEVLDHLGVSYLIGGSLASAVHGVARATADADLLADLRLEHAEPLTEALTDAFYVDAAAIRDAITNRSSFNAIHLQTMFKVDVFVSQPGPFHRSQFHRRVEHVVATDPERTAYFASAEDTVLAKLDWFCRGGQVSDRQWRDVLGVLQAQADRLDRDYLRVWARSLRIGDLLEKALGEAGVGTDSGKPTAV